MITVISHDLLAKGDVAAILESTGSEYVHVSSAPKKVSLINLGMSPQNFSSFKSSNSLNVFGKQFKPTTLEKLGTDVCVISDGVLSTEEFTTLSELIAQLNGKMTLVGVGIGKELLMAATNTSNDWQLQGETWTLSTGSAYGVDTYNQLNDLGVL